MIRGNTALPFETQLIWTYLKPQARRVILVAALLVGGLALQLVNPQVVRFFIDTAQARAPQGPLLAAALLYLVVALIRQALNVAARYMTQNVGWTATNALRAGLALHLLRLDLSFHKQHTPGELIERIDGDITTLADLFSQFVIRVAANVLLVFGILALLYREDVRVGLALTVYAALTLAILFAMQRLAVPYFVALRQASAEQYGLIQERIGGAEDIRASGAEAYMLYRLYQLMRRLLNAVRTAWLVRALTSSLTNLLFVIGYALGLGVGAYLYQQGQATIGTAFLIVSYIGMLATPLQSLREQAQGLQEVSASLGRVRELFALESRLEPHHPNPPFPATPEVPKAVRRGEAKAERGGNLAAESSPQHSDGEQRTWDQGNTPPAALSIRGVSFAYRDGRPEGAPASNGDDHVLHDLSFDLAPGRVLGVLGRTGSGKSTLMRLMFRLYDPLAGEIVLDGTDLRALPLETLRARVGVVTQEVQLFQATLRDNLTFFNPRVTDREIEAALAELRMDDWVRALPRGLDTPLAAEGRGLSAGEAQLLAFTRVFLRRPGLVILDEASSRLDPATESRLERAVDRLLAGRTGIVIAHRLRTLQRADDILILEQGRIVERGPQAALAANPASRFYHLLQTGLEEALG